MSNKRSLGKQALAAVAARDAYVLAILRSEADEWPDGSEQRKAIAHARDRLAEAQKIGPDNRGEGWEAEA